MVLCKAILVEAQAADAVVRFVVHLLYSARTQAKRLILCLEKTEREAAALASVLYELPACFQHL